MSKINLNGLRKYTVMIILVVLMVLFSFSSPYFLTLRNLTNIINQNTYFIIAAIGLSFVMIGGGIDLSVGYQMSLVGVVTGMCMVVYHIPVWLSVAVGLLLGSFLGFFNGMIVTNIRVFPLIVTIATSTVFQGLSYIISKAQTFRGFPPQFLALTHAQFLGITLDVWLTLLIVLIANFVYNRMSFGWNVLALGGNEEASRLAGIKTKVMKVSVYTLCGFFVAIATMVMISKANTTSSMFGPGIRVYGFDRGHHRRDQLHGRGRQVWGLVAGVFILAVLGNGMQLAGWGTYAQYIVKGIILLGAVAFDEYQRNARMTKSSTVKSEPASPAKSPA